VITKLLTRFLASNWLLAMCIASLAFAAEPMPTVHLGETFAARDTLAPGDEPNEDAKECLKNLVWRPAKFTVRLEAAEPGCGDYRVCFLSARPLGDGTIDNAAMEWFVARDADGEIRRAPAVVVVHESGRRMTVGRLIARGIAAKGVHAFLVNLPGYGARRVAGFPKVEQIMPAMHEAIADVRRARDAVAALPAIEPSAIGLQGTSLGGFVAAGVAGLDHGYQRVFIVLAGGNLEEVLFHGSNEVAKARGKLAAAGITDDQIRTAAHELEPLRLAHRIRPAETWLYCGKFDTVVPPRCSEALAKAAHLADDHFIEFSANHYSGVVYLPTVVEQISKRMNEAAGK
jgi:dienelactone hydrolase